jgi:tRNA(fMet)-specific endonuclease VapC
LDTDILSEILKSRNQQVLARADEYLAAFGSYTATVLSVVEIVKGFHKVRREQAIQQFLARLPTIAVLLPLDEESGEIAGRIEADLERTGQPIGSIDALIAGIALEHDLVLVTGNQSHYQRVQALGYGLRLDNWRT